MPTFLRSTHALPSTLVLAALANACAPPASRPAESPPSQRAGSAPVENYVRVDAVRTSEPAPYFVKDGTPFCFVGTNNYYLTYESKAAGIDLLDTAVRLNAKVLRIWAYLDRGSLDKTVGNIREPGHKEGVYFQYWDPVAGRPAYNDGPDGLQRLDWVVHEARQRGLLLTLVLTNNWRDFGGMDQYLRWYGLTKHHEFYTDERVRSAFKDWIAHVLTRQNSIDGVPYLEDPAIFAWELANEPRTINFESYDSPDGWDGSTITRWADEMSAFIESIDPNHMVAVGDEGFMNGGRNAWPYEAPHGVDSEALSRLPHVDFGTYHLYPDHWALGQHFGNDWIEDHIALSRRVGKPFLLEEYGIHVRRQEESSGPVVHGWPRRQVAYSNWNDLVLERGGAGAMFWLLAGMQQPGRLYPDYDHFTVYAGDESYRLLESYAVRMPDEAAACTLARASTSKERQEEAKSPFASARAPN